MPQTSIPEAIAAFRAGKFVIIVDDEDRENEGDLAIAAEAVTAEAIAFMARHGRGLICVPMAGADLDRLGLPLMVPAGRNETPFGTAFTVSVEARAGVTTGISAADRARTIQVLASPASGPADLVQPGHVFPLRCHPGGVRARAGQTEAAVELARLGGLQPAAVICEVMDDDGRMARLPSLARFSRQHQIPIISIADLIAYLEDQERHQDVGVHASRALAFASHGVQRLVGTHLPTAVGRFHITAYQERNQPAGPNPHLALVTGDLSGPEPVLTRLHSECLTGDVFGSSRCDCGEQLHAAMERISAAERGVILYLRQEGRGIGLINKLHAYELQDAGLDTIEANHHLGFPADGRDYGAAAAMLRDLGISRVELLTNNPRKVEALNAHGIEVVARIPLEVRPGQDNQRYLSVKQQKLGHLLEHRRWEHTAQ